MRIRPSMQVLQLSKFIYRDLSCLRKVAQCTDSLLIFTICTYSTTCRASNNNTMQRPYKSKSTWQLHILSTYSALPIIKNCISNAKSAEGTHKKQNKTEIQLQTKLSCHGSKFQFSFPYLMQIQQVIGGNTGQQRMKKGNLFLVPSTGISVNYERSYVRRETQEKRRKQREGKLQQPNQMLCRTHTECPTHTFSYVSNLYRVSHTFLLVRQQHILSVPHIQFRT